jgi:hypothetical protein
MTGIRRPSQRAPRDWNSKPLYFADRDLRLPLVRQDFDGATPGTLDDCPIAHACNRILGASLAEIGRTYSYVDFGKFGVKYTTRDIARLVTVAYDNKVLARGDATVTLGKIPPSGRTRRIPGAVRGSGGGNPPRITIPNPLLRPRAGS